jgi:hypothetical protein
MRYEAQSCRNPLLRNGPEKLKLATPIFSRQQSTSQLWPRAPKPRSKFVETTPALRCLARFVSYLLILERAYL